MSYAPAVHASPRLLGCLDDGAIAALAAAPLGVRRAIEQLVSDHPVARVLGLDAVSDVLLREGALRHTAAAAVPFLLALATSPRYPHASPLLARLEALLAAIDDPPRSAATRAPDDPIARAVYEGFVRSLTPLLRVARRSRDPEACRAAARIASHFPSADADSVPLLIALLSGVRDERSRAPLAAALERARARL
jgi:hypothetical protein